MTYPRTVLCFASFFVLLLTTHSSLHSESGIYDRIGIIAEHGIHGAVPEENIDLFTGNLTLKNLDINLPGPNGFDLKIWRVYNSKILKDRLAGGAWGLQQEPYSWVGYGWSMHMGRLHDFNSQTPVIEYPDGRWETAYHNIDDYSTFITRDFTKLDTTNWKLYFKDGSVWTFGSLASYTNGNMFLEQVRVVTKITNSYGHEINVSYDGAGSPRMSSITDSMGRIVSFISDATLHKLKRIDVKNANGNTVSYSYSVGEFNGDFYRLDSFDPPLLPAVTYEYGNGLSSNYELLAVNTSYGGRMEYEYEEHDFYYEVYILNTKVVSKKRIRFSTSSAYNTWTYTYPSYHNTTTGTVEVAGPVFTTYATYHAYSNATPWKIGLLKEKTLSDNSFSEQYGWISRIVSNTRWYVLNIDMGQAAAPMQSTITKSTSGDSDTNEEILYERTATSKYGLPTRINVYANGSLKNHKDIQYYFESNPTFETKFMLNHLKSEILYNSANTKLRETSMAYYANGALDSVTKWRSGSTDLIWDYTYSSSNPNLITITVDLPGNGGTETMTYKYGVLATLSHPGYTEYSRTISAHDSSILSETNQHGGTMNFSYDNLGRITGINMPSGFNDVSASWATNSVTITQGGNTVFKYWDGMGRDTGHIEQGGGINLYYRKTLDAEGRTIAESKGSTESAIDYDYVLTAAGQVKKITDPRGKITTITLTGDQRTVTDANSHDTIFEYTDLPGLVTRLTDPSGKIATYAYDGIGRLLSTTFNSNRTQSYIYNGLDQVTSETHPETGSITYAYSSANNLDTKTWSGVSTNYTYNNDNQVLTENAGDETITYSYDDNGRVNSVSSGQGWSKTGITYNSLGSITREIISIPGLAAKTISYSYDGNNQLNQITYPDGRVATYSNNGLNMPETVAFNGSSIVSAVAYGISKQPISITNSANGTSYTATYNNNGGIISAQLKKSSTYLLNTSYAYDGVGNITTLSNSNPDFSASFSYDELNRLTGASYTPSGVGRVNNFSYIYDAYGNMTQAKENAVTVFTQDYTNKNQANTLTYDGRGNVISSSQFDYAWDKRNRLSQMTSKPSGESAGSFLYDEKGMRLKANRPVVQTITVTSPAADVTWPLGSVKTITWTSTGNVSGPLSIKLRLASDPNAPPVLSIADSVANTGTFSWTIPANLATGNYTIRVRTVSDSPLVYGDSPSFVIAAGAPTITVVNPAAGVVWPQGSNQTITWTSSGGVSGPLSIKLRLADDPNAPPVLSIVDSIDNTGTFSWTIPITVATGQYLIRIRTISDSPLVYGESESFSIGGSTPTISVVNPAAGAVWPQGNSQTITWTSSGGLVGPLSVILNLANDPNAPPVLSIVDSIDDTGTFNWTVPSTVASDNYKIRVRTLSESPLVYGDSPAFSIATGTPTITVINPAAGAVWPQKSSQTITWTSSGGVTGPLSIKLRLANAPDAPPVLSIADNIDNTGTFNWTIPDTVPVGEYLIRVRTVSDLPLVYDDGENFTIGAGSGLNLITPNGSEKWQAGSVQNILWSGGEDIRELKIEYSTDLGSTYQLVTINAPNTGIYSWQVPDMVSDHCLIRISDASGQSTLENSVLQCDLAFALKGDKARISAPLLSLWLQQPSVDEESSQRFIPMLTLSRSELKDGFRLDLGEFSADFENIPESFEKTHRIKLQWDIMDGRGTVFFDEKAMLLDIPLLPVIDVVFTPSLILKTGAGISSLRLDDFKIALVQIEDAPSDNAGMLPASTQVNTDSTVRDNQLFNEDFESYQPDEPLSRGGWSAAFVIYGIGARAANEPSDKRERKEGWLLDTQAPIAGLGSGLVTIPANTTLTLTKPISWPERLPFAVSARQFAIVPMPQANHDPANSHPSAQPNDIQEDTDAGDMNLHGPNTVSPAIKGIAATPYATLATEYNTTYYIYSYDGKLLAEYDAVGACKKDYVYMGGKLLAEYQPTVAKYYHYTSDQINSTRIITDSAGTVVYSALFDPYGGMQKQWVNTYQPSLKFSSKEREAKGEMDYFGARYYDHLKYRFISVDPMINKKEALTNPQLWNLYSYCRNSPVTYSDPNGTYDKDVHYFLTKYLALQAGFSKSDAEIIAASNQRIDEDSRTSANAQYVGKKGFRTQARAWHFASDERVFEVLQQAFISGDLSKLGAALHCFQDSLFAHKKYRESASHFWESLSFSSDPDNTANDVGMALEMAQGTLNILNFFWKRNEYKKISADFSSKIFLNPISPLRAKMISEAK